MTNVFTVESSTDWHLPKKSCLINFSTLSELFCVAPFRSFSIKYVTGGVEKYYVNGRTYTIEGGSYLLANHFSEGYVEIDKTVKGICIDVAPDLLSEVVASYLRSDTPVSDPGLDVFFNSRDFLENKYNVSETNVGRMLRGIERAPISDQQDKPEFSREFYFGLAENILLDHIPVYRQLQSIRAIKASAKKDLYHRLMRGKEYIDLLFLENLSVAEVAKESGMSEYHFYRMFKSAFGKSPLQYIIGKRLSRGNELLKKHQMSVTDVAENTGFSNVHAFSKSYRKHFGRSPGTTKKFIATSAK